MKYIILLLILLIKFGLNAQELTLPDSCLEYYFPVDVYGPTYNLDSIKFDNRDKNKGLSYEAVWYVRWLELDFGKGYVFKTDSISSDLVFSYELIDTVKYKYLYTRLKNIESKYGSFKMRRSKKCENDSVFRIRALLNLRFENYYKFDSLIHDFTDSINGICNANVVNWPTVVSVKDERNTMPKITIIPKDNYEYISISINTQETITDKIQYKIFDIFGKCLEQEIVAPDKNEVDINVSAFPVGCYFLQINNTFSKFMITR